MGGLLNECSDTEPTTFRSSARDNDEITLQRNRMRSALTKHGLHSFRANQTNLRFVGSLYGLKGSEDPNPTIRRVIRNVADGLQKERRGLIRMYVANTATLTQMSEIPWHYRREF